MTTGTIRELPVQQRPRERLLHSGVSALTDAELIAILLRTGTRGMNAVELAELLLQRFGSFAQLARATVAQISQTKGIGRTKAVQLTAAFGLGSRLAAEKYIDHPLDNPEAVYDLVGPDLRLLDRESLQVLLLDTRYRLISRHEISRGTLNESLAHPREILKPAISQSAYAFVLFHNHPSGDPSPSEADLRLTRRIVEASRILQITLLDHLIIGFPQNGRSGYFSFKEHGIIGG